MIPLSPADLAALSEILREYAGCHKRAAPGEALATRVDPVGAAPPVQGDRESLRRAVHVADFMAACGPDNAGRPWDPARAEFASRLRTLFWQTFRENAYAD